MPGRTTARWFLTLQVGLCFILVFARGSEDAEEAYRNGRSLVLEYFLPINLPAAADVPLRREKRDEEGSGEDEAVFSVLNEKKEDVDNSTQSVFNNFIFGESEEELQDEGSGEVENLSDSSEITSEESAGTIMPAIAEAEMKEEVETTHPTLTSTEMFFDKSEDFEEISNTEDSEETTAEPTVTVRLINTTMETTTLMESRAEQFEYTTLTREETTTMKPQVTTVVEETTTESVTVVTHLEVDIPTSKPTEIPTTVPDETTTVEPPITVPVVIPLVTTTEAPQVVTTTFKFALPTERGSEGLPNTAIASSTPKFEMKMSETLPASTEPPKSTEPVVEETFVETKIGKKLEALPGNILQKENLSLAADPLLIANTRLMDSEENVQLSSSEPKRMGAYIVIGLILLSFSSLVGYITFRRRMNRKRQEFESHQESNDTEKALLSLNDYKDNSELEENHLKNNEITPIVVKSNTQINKFEKNTNFSSPKNLNTIANEKNIEKDNVLKSTAENLTQVIIEDSPKDVEEDKNVPNLEKLIVKTRIDQDSIPKKPIIINRSSTGYMPIPQDNS